LFHLETQKERDGDRDGDAADANSNRFLDTDTAQLNLRLNPFGISHTQKNDVSLRPVSIRKKFYDKIKYKTP